MEEIDTRQPRQEDDSSVNGAHRLVERAAVNGVHEAIVRAAADMNYASGSRRPIDDHTYRKAKVNGKPEKRED